MSSEHCSMPHESMAWLNHSDTTASWCDLQSKLLEMTPSLWRGRLWETETHTWADYDTMGLTIFLHSSKTQTLWWFCLLLVVLLHIFVVVMHCCFVSILVMLCLFEVILESFYVFFWLFCASVWLAESLCRYFLDILYLFEVVLCPLVICLLGPFVSFLVVLCPFVII